MRYAHLSRRGIVAISGPDAVSFLQGMITNDAQLLERGEAVYAALLSPQGKYLHDFFLVSRNEKIFLDGEKARLGDLVKRLSLYRLRSKVTIEPAPELSVVATWDNQAISQIPDSAFCAFPDPRLPELGYRLIGERAAVEAYAGEHGWQEGRESDYDRLRLEAGVPDGSRDMEIDRAIILHYGFEELHGVDFAKGCYVGQEVIARTHYRGQIRKFIHQVRAGRDLPAPGTPVLLGEAQAGELLSVSGNIGLAMLRLDEVEKARSAGIKLRAGDTEITASLPGWAEPQSSGGAARE